MEELYIDINLEDKLQYVSLNNLYKYLPMKVGKVYHFVGRKLEFWHSDLELPETTFNLVTNVKDSSEIVRLHGCKVMMDSRKHGYFYLCVGYDALEILGTADKRNYFISKLVSSQS
jgi:hypothetical protein